VLLLTPVDGPDGTITPLVCELLVMSSAAMSLIVDREQVDASDTVDDEASVAIISVIVCRSDHYFIYDSILVFVDCLHFSKVDKQ